MPSRCRAWSWRPLSILFISTLIVFSWPMPPPLSTIERAPSTSSTSGLRPVRESGMKSPAESRPTLAVPWSGSTSAMYFSPSRLVWRTSTWTFSGSLMSLRTRNLTRACQPWRRDLGHLSDHDVVDHDRRARHHVEGVG